MSLRLPRLRLWPAGIAGRLVVLLLLALLASHVLAFWIFTDERRFAIEAVRREQVLDHVVPLVRLLATTPPATHAAIVESASSRQLRFALGPKSLVEATPVHAENPLARRLRRDLRGSARIVLVDIHRLGPFWRPEQQAPERRDRDRPADDRNEDARDDDDDADEARSRPFRHRPAPFGLAVAVQLADGRWLNGEIRLISPVLGFAVPTLAAMAATAVAVVLVVTLSVRRLTRPLRALAVAADRLGRGEATEPLPESGPVEVQATTRAFNEMQARLRRFVDDRTRMLAAIGHDLRTPITTLRLRAELLEDDEARERILATLDEMQRMVEATLAFARDEAAAEPSRTVDVAALAQSVAEDLADLGLPVSFEDAGEGAGSGAAGHAARLPLRCRPLALKRALRNLIENAVRYGNAARVRVMGEPGEVLVRIDDDGPGIPDAMLERVFEPFFRLEGSRSQETGGVGLGLAIARTVVRGHGGEITLANRPEGGLRATVRLPRGGEEPTA